MDGPKPIIIRVRAAVRPSIFLRGMYTTRARGASPSHPRDLQLATSDKDGMFSKLALTAFAATVVFVRVVSAQQPVWAQCESSRCFVELR